LPGLFKAVCGKVLSMAGDDFTRIPEPAERKQLFQMPQTFSDIIEMVSSEDRAYFEQHPGHSFYWRPYVPGELWPAILPGDAWIEVSQIRPGARTRIPHFKGVAGQKDIEEYARLHGENKKILICSEEGEPVGVALS